jgi:hypothetical protein
MDKSMTVQHKNLSLSQWSQLSISEQMSHIGSEVNRALNWQKKGNDLYCQKAFARALELIDLSLDSTKSFPHLKEFARLREAIVDYFFGSNKFSSSEKSWRKYFDHFNYMARKQH